MCFLRPTVPLGGGGLPLTLGTEQMSKTERTLVGVFLAGICPLLAFVMCWWTAAVVHACMPGVSVNAVIVTALSGLLAGIVLDLLLLRKWIRRFYTSSLWLMAAIYGALCVVAVAFFMGLPVGTFGLGILAGIYAGRRQRHAAAKGAAVGRDLAAWQAAGRSNWQRIAECRIG